MLRYARLYAYFLRFSFSRAMEFRLDFFFRVGMDALWYAVHLSFFTVLYRHTQALGGWSYDLFRADGLVMWGVLTAAPAAMFVGYAVFALLRWRAARAAPIRGSSANEL